MPRSLWTEKGRRIAAAASSFQIDEAQITTTLVPTLTRL